MSVQVRGGGKMGKGERRRGRKRERGREKKGDG